MIDLPVLRDFVSRWLADHGFGGVPVVWKWQVIREDADLAAPLQGHHLSMPQEGALVAAILHAFPDLGACFFDHGFLNLRFASRSWGMLIQNWVANPVDFLAEASIPGDLWQITIFWRYRLLKTFHEAAILAEMKGWDTEQRMDYEPKASEMKMLKLMLSLGGLLQQKRDVQGKRLEMMTQIQEQIALLWQEPILFPVDPAGSAWRQGLLRLALQAAEAIGAPSKQSLTASLQRQW